MTILRTLSPDSLNLGDVRCLLTDFPVFEHLIDAELPANLDTPGIYILAHRDYFYIGMSTSLIKRLSWHHHAWEGKVDSGGGVSTKYWNVVRKSRQSIPTFYVLHWSSFARDDANLSSRLQKAESLFLGLAEFQLGPSRLMNVCKTSTFSRKLPVSAEERARRSVVMKRVISDLMETPGYAEELSERNRRLYRELPERSIEERRLRISSGVKRSFDANPQRRIDCANNARRLWERPDFSEVNSRRLRKLRDGGWRPSGYDVLIITFPDGRKFPVRSSAVSHRVFGIGGIMEGFHVDSVRLDNVEASLLDPVLNDCETDFKAEPFVEWMLAFTKKYPKSWHSAKPALVKMDGRELIVPFPLHMKRILKMDVDIIEYVPTLWECFQRL